MVPQMTVPVSGLPVSKRMMSSSVGRGRNKLEIADVSTLAVVFGLSGLVCVNDGGGRNGEGGGYRPRSSGGVEAWSSLTHMAAAYRQVLKAVGMEWKSAALRADSAAAVFLVSLC